MPEMTDEQLEEAIEGMGEKVTVDSKQKMKAMMEKSEDVLKTTMLKGSSTEIPAAPFQLCRVPSVG